MLTLAIVGFAVGLTASPLAAPLQRRTSDICSRDLTVEVDDCADLNVLLGAVTLMTTECAAYFTSTMVVPPVPAPEDIDRAILCPCMMMAKSKTLAAGEIQAEQLAAQTAAIGECNAARLADATSKNVFNLGAEADWCTSCWAADNGWTSETAGALYATAEELIVAATESNDDGNDDESGSDDGTPTSGGGAKSSFSMVTYACSAISAIVVILS